MIKRAMKQAFIPVDKIRPLWFIALTVLANPSAAAPDAAEKPLLLHAARVFDGRDVKADMSVLVKDGRIARIGAPATFAAEDAQRVELGDATILPGFIELHAHLAFQHIAADTVLRHGVTTLRDVGGPVHQPYGGDGSLRVLTSGLIITAPDGYPIPGMGADNIAVPVATEQEARDAVRRQIDGGAAVIKVALEPGGEPGAPWSAGHGHGHGHTAHAAHAGTEHAPPHGKAKHKTALQPKAWPLLPENIVKAIVDEAHKRGRKVTAHIAEVQGAALALNAGIDEWAHMPCDVLPDAVLKRAATQQVKIVGTLDTLSKCPGVAYNTGTWTALGGELLYGSEVAHPDIPWGIDAQELMYMMHMGRLQPLDVLRAATSKAGEHLGVPLLGTLQPGAPADLIAVRGDPLHSFKVLEYPGLVVSGGKVIVNHFTDAAPVLAQMPSPHHP